MKTLFPLMRTSREVPNLLDPFLDPEREILLSAPVQPVALARTLPIVFAASFCAAVVTWAFDNFHHSNEEAGKTVSLFYGITWVKRSFFLFSAIQGGKVGRGPLALFPHRCGGPHYGPF
jgi:hypothetical protein